MIVGNVSAEIQTYKSEKNEIGELVKLWEKVITLKGFLDLSAGRSDYEKMNTKIEESTHVFICSYISLPGKISANNSRMIIGGRIFDIMLIDNPMELNRHYEIYLKLCEAAEGR